MHDLLVLLWVWLGGKVRDTAIVTVKTLETYVISTSDRKYEISRSNRTYKVSKSDRKYEIEVQS